MKSSLGNHPVGHLELLNVKELINQNMIFMKMLLSLMIQFKPILAESLLH